MARQRARRGALLALLRLRRPVANRVYTLLWEDGDPSSGVYGARARGEGSYRLLQGRTVVARGSMARPNDGKVADTGVFIFNDWGFGSGLHGTFRAFSAQGEKLLEHAFRLNLYNNGLAADGTLAACQLCNSPNEYGGTLAVFDLREGRRVAHWVPETGWAEHYTFDPAQGRIDLVYRDGSAVT